MTRLPVSFVVALSLVACSRAVTSGTQASAPMPAAVIAPVTGSFAIMRGADTVGMERFTRAADRLEAEFTAGGHGLYRYDAALRPDASVSRIVITPVGDAAAAGSRPATATFTGDSVTLVQGADSMPIRRAAPAGTVPYVNPSPSLMEQIVRRARSLGGTAAQVPVLRAGGAGVVANAAVSFVGDSARLDLAGVAVQLRVNAAGAILGGTVPSQNLTIVRVGAP